MNTRTLATAIVATAFATYAAHAQLDDRWTVTVNGRSVVANPDGSFRVANISAPDLFGPDGPGSPRDGVADDPLQVVANTVIDGVPFYAFGQPFFLRRGDLIIIPAGSLTVTDVAPLLPIRLTFLAATTVLEPQQQLQAAVLADLPDGTQADLTARQLWTTYRTSNPAIVSIGADGLMTAGEAGTAIVTAMNAGVTTARRIIVTAETQPASVAGLVLLADGSPVAGATVSTLNYGGTATTAADGSFLMPLTLPLNADPLVVQAQATVGSETFIGLQSDVEVVPGEIADAGIIELTESAFIWTNPAGGSWHTASNWSRNAVPGANDHVRIVLDGTYTVTIATIGGSCRSLALGGATGEQSLRVSGVTLTAQEEARIGRQGRLLLPGGTLTAAVINGGLVSPDGSSGTVNAGPGGFENTSQGTIRLGGVLTVNGDLSNEGRVDLVSAGAVLSVATGTLTNAGTIEARRGGNPDGVCLIHGSTINNPGTITNVDVSDLRLGVGGATLTVNNTGTINVQSGALSNWSGNSFPVNTLTFNNSGTVNFAPGTLYRQWVGSVNLNGGTFGSPDMHIDLRQVTLSHPTDFHTSAWASLFLRGCVFNGPGVFVNDRPDGQEIWNDTIFNTLVDNRTSLTWTALGVSQSLRFNQGLLNPAGGLLRLIASNQGSTARIEGDFTNEGTVHLSGWGASLVATGTLTNAGTIEARRDGNPDGTRYLDAPTINNPGTITNVDVSDLQLGLLPALTVNNTGTINVQSGALSNWSGSGGARDLTFNNSGTVNFAPGTLYRHAFGRLNLNGGTFGAPDAHLNLYGVTIHHTSDFRTSDWASIFLRGCVFSGPGVFVNDRPDGQEIRDYTTFNTLVDNRTSLTNTLGAVRFNQGLLNSVGSLLRVNSSATIVGDFMNEGTVHLSGLGANLVATGTLTNAGTIEARRDGNPDGTRYLDAPTINNPGTITNVDVSDLQLGLLPALTVNNTGTINVQSGALSNWSGSGGARDLTFNNSGTVNFAPGTLYRHAFGRLNLNGGTFGAPDAHLNLYGVTIHHTSDFRTSDWASIFLRGCVFNGQGVFINDRPDGQEIRDYTTFNTLVDNRTSLTWTGGTGLQFNQNLRNPAGALLRLIGDNNGSSANFPGDFTNEGTVQLAGRGVGLIAGGTLTNAGTIEARRDGNPDGLRTIHAPTINNPGTITNVDVADLVLGLGNQTLTVNNTGAIHVLHGRVANVGGIAGQTVINSGTLYVAPGARYEHRSTGLHGTSGGFVQTDSGTTRIDVTAPLSTPALNVISNATLAGTLAIAPVDGYMPMLGDSFTPMCYLVRPGGTTFDLITLEDDTILTLESNYDPDCLRLTVIAP